MPENMLSLSTEYSLYVHPIGATTAEETTREAMASSSGGVFTAARHLSAAMRRNGAGVRQPLGVLRLRSGMGLPTGTSDPPSAPVDEEHELIWDDGTPHPEHIYEVDEPVGKWEALAWLSGGLSIFAVLGVVAHWRAKTTKRPFPLRHYPWLELDDRLNPYNIKPYDQYPYNTR